MKRFLVGLMCVACMLGFSSCAVFLVGAGVAGGMAVSKDTAKLEIDKNMEQAWSAATGAIKQLGVITAENKKAGTIEADVRDVKVKVTIIQMTPKSVRVEVKSRKNMMPQMDLSTEILNKIHEQLKFSLF